MTVERREPAAEQVSSGAQVRRRRPWLPRLQAPAPRTEPRRGGEGPDRLPAGPGGAAAAAGAAVGRLTVGLGAYELTSLRAGESPVTGRALG